MRRSTDKSPPCLVRQLGCMRAAHDFEVVSGFLLVSSLPPQPFKPCGIGGGVLDGMLNIPMAEIVLNQPRIGTLVGEGKAAGMAEHMRVCLNRQACVFAIAADHEPYRLTTERAAPLTIRLRLHSRPFRQPGFYHSNFICPEWIRRGQA